MRFVVSHSGIGTTNRLHGYLALVPGTGGLIQEIIERTSKKSNDLTRSLKTFADREAEYLKILDFRWPPIWKQTGWPKVVEKLTVGLKKVRDAAGPSPTGVTPGSDPWCTVCSDLSAHIEAHSPTSPVL
jgi:hypothetical protein